MRILIIHNYYQHPGGEDVVFEQEKALLSKTETVFSLTFNNHTGWRGAWQTAWSPWNLWTGRILKRAIRQHKPDLIHIHNLHYAIGPLAIRIAKRMGIPLVMTLHNYRLLCPSATLFHNGQPFLDSLHATFPWKAVHLGVHSHSVFKTLWLASTICLHKQLGTWNKVDRYLALTDFAKQLFVHSSLGIPQEKFVTKPNFTVDGTHQKVIRSNHFLFIGRLSQEKGVNVLLQAFTGSGMQLRIAGDGPLRDTVVKAAQTDTNITYLGALDRKSLGYELAVCTALIFPSIWYEGMPMTLLEAFAAGTPVIASNLGAMQSMVHHEVNGWLFVPNDASSLRLQARKWLLLDDTRRRQLSIQARESYERTYTAEENRTSLLAIYHAVTGAVL